MNGEGMNFSEFSIAKMVLIPKEFRVWNDLGVDTKNKCQCLHIFQFCFSDV